MEGLVIDLGIAAVPFGMGLALTWRLVWPRWKLAAKAFFYFGAVTGLSLAIGHYSLLVAFAHQFLGMASHYWFCRRHGFTWYGVEDPQRYVALSKRSVGIDDGTQLSSREGRP